MPSGTAALNQLRAQPVTWLQANPMTVYANGSSIKPSTFFIAHDGRKYKVAPQKYGFGGDAFAAWHVPVDSSSNVTFSSLTAVPVSRQGGPDIVLTTQLTGCCFACASNNDMVFMQHVQPQGTTPAKLASDMGGGSFSGVGPIQMAFGSDGVSYDNAKNRVIIVGLRTQRTWRIYAQIQDSAFNVLTARKIWEG